MLHVKPEFYFVIVVYHFELVPSMKLLMIAHDVPGVLQISLETLASLLSLQQYTRYLMKAQRSRISYL